MIGSYSWLNGVFNSWFSQDLDKIMSSVKLVEGKLRSKSMAVQVGAISGDKIIPLHRKRAFGGLGFRVWVGAMKSSRARKKTPSLPLSNLRSN